MRQYRQVIPVLLLFILIIKTGAWRNISKYYKNLLYVIFMNCIYYYFCKRHLLWEFNVKKSNWRLLRVVHIFIVTPLLTLLNLSYFPKTIPDMILHLFKAVSISLILEIFALKYKLIRFKHDWNLFWSGVIYLKMYLYSYIFTRNAVLTWILSFASLIMFIIKFKIPLGKRLAKGPVFLFSKYF